MRAPARARRALSTPPGRLAAVAVGLALACAAAVPTLAHAVPPRRTLGGGAWCWFADPRGVDYEGARKQTFIGWGAQKRGIKGAALHHGSRVRPAAGPPSNPPG